MKDALPSSDSAVSKARPWALAWLDNGILWIGRLLSWLFLFTVLISFYEILMRYLFNAPTMWVHETASFLGGALFLFGGAYALANNTHVRVVLVYDHVSDKARRYLNLFHHICGLLFSALLIFGAWRMTENSWFAPWGDLRLETSGSAWNPPFPALLKGMVLLTVCVLFCQFVLHLINEVRLILSPQDTSDRESHDV
jgi:TRAP-type mannitol/chloroaromatic compound transport system permease small subunit